MNDGGLILKKLALYLTIALIGGLILATLALLAVGEGLLPNPFSRPEEDLPEAEPSPPPKPKLARFPEVLRPVVELEWLLELPVEDREEGLRDLGARDDAVGYQARVRLARDFNEVDWEEADNWYQKAFELYRNPSVYWEWAALLVRAEADERAAAAYLDLLPEEDAIDQLLELGVTKQTITRELAKRGAWESILEFHEETPKLQEARFFFARALWEKDMVDEAREHFESLSENDYEAARWWWARTLEHAGDKDKALEIYEELGAEGAYRAGIILEERDDREAAAVAFGRSTEPEALWRGARIWDERGEHARALDLYLRVADTESTLWDDAAYRAYLLLDEGDPRRGGLLEQLEHRPAWMQRLGRDPEWALSSAIEPEEPKFWARRRAYEKTERHEMAALETRIGEDQVDPSGKAFLAEYYLDSGHYERSVRWGADLLYERPCPIAYRLAYPTAYRELVLDAADEFGVDPHLIWAVMREESRFQPEVVSWAGAVGLMQVMPDTGAQIARELDQSFDPDVLKDPHTSIRFGTYYLNRMLEQFETQDAALAAYNAGPGNAARWLDTPLGESSLTFPTAVTFRETRLYITRVRDSQIIYEWLDPD